MSAPTAFASVVDGMPDAEYHAHRALSASGAKLLIRPGGPELYQWRRANPERKSEYDIGHAAHHEVLGTGPRLLVVEAADWRTKAAKEARADAYAQGAVPILIDQWAGVQAMAARLREHPLAGQLLQPGRGVAEQSLFWTDPATGVPCRVRTDWRTRLADGRTVVVDYKTCASAAPDAIARAVPVFGYHIQGPFYLDAIRAAGLGDDDALFLLVFQERTAPYLVHVVQLDAAAMRIGAHLAHRAREIWRDCTAAGVWPGYGEPAEATVLSLPRWAEAQYEEEFA